MFGYFLRHKELRATLAQPTKEQQIFFIDCFSAGFARGVKDTRDAVPSGMWVELVTGTSMRLAREHSAADAGCWLAGVINGRIAAAEDRGQHSIEQLLRQQMPDIFYAAWKSGHIQECSQHTIAPFLRRRTGPASMLYELC